MYEVLIHLLQSTLFAGIAGLLTLVLKKNHARARYWLWLAASVKFLIPFSLLVEFGSRLGWTTGHPVMRRMTVVIAETHVALKHLDLNFGPLAAPQPSYTTVLPALVILWAFGCMAVLFYWWLRWRRVTAVVRAAAPLTEGRELEAVRRVETSLDPAGKSACATAVLRSSTTLEPGIFGILRPSLLLPAGIADRLDDAQLDAIVAHELCHARRRDNLMAAIHMVIEAVFWFHPLVWWLGARLVDERERACDEEVLSMGSKPDAYAEGILKVCRFYLESPLVCVAGITGSNLRRRIERIMTQHAGSTLGFARRLLLTTIGIAAVAVPVAIGIMNPRQVMAQVKVSTNEVTAFEVASIKPGNPGNDNASMLDSGGGRFTATNATLKMLVRFAYNISDHQLSGGPAWFDSDRYVIVAKAPQSNPTPEQYRAMIQALLADRFHLVIHRESKELPEYWLVVDKNGPKMQGAEPEAAGQDSRRGVRLGRGVMNAQGVPMPMFARIMENVLGRSVSDRTGLSGNYNFKLAWTPDETQFRGHQKPGVEEPPSFDPDGPSLFTALQEQLGLKLESRKGPVEVVVVDRAEKPSEN